MAPSYRSLRVHMSTRRTFIRDASLSIAGIAMMGCKGSDSASGASPQRELNPLSTNEEFYAVWFRGQAAEIERDDWRLAIQREGQTLGELDWTFVESLSAEEQEFTLQCIESRPGLERMNNALWGGLPLSEFLDIAGIVVDGGNYIRFGCADGYSMALPVSDMERPIWLLWTMNCAPLPLDHGFPIRAIIPGRTGWLNAKQIIEIDFIDDPYELPWLGELQSWLESQNLTMDTDERSMTYQVQTLIVDPHEIVLVDQGRRVEILGKAFAGSDPVTLVELSTDGGMSWQCAELTYNPGANRWTLWRFEWIPECAGTHHIEVRCRTELGSETDPDASLNHLPWSGGMSLEIEVV